MTPTRAQRLEQIRELKARGLTSRQIAAEVGVAVNTVRDYLSDPTGAKARARKASYAGVCIECGGPTNGGSGPGKASLRCSYCVRGIPSGRAHRPTRRRTVPVRLDELPVDVRLDGARDAIRIESGDERIALLEAALFPSDTVYWLAESARPLLEQLRIGAAAEAA